MKKAFSWSITAVGVICLVFFLGIFVGRRTNVITQTSSDDTVSHSQNASTVYVIDPTEKININTADAETLQKLPGIGEVLALRIIAYRTENGPFSSVRDLQKVDGIGAGKLMEIIEIICVEDSP